MKAKTVRQRDGALVDIDRRVRAAIKALRAGEERIVAKRFLGRAMGRMKGVKGGGRASVEALSAELWRVVVAVSHVSGTFDGRRKGGR